MKTLLIALSLSFLASAAFADTPPGLPDPGGKPKKEEPKAPPVKPAPPKVNPEESGIGPVESSGNDKMVVWKDPVTGYSYMYIPKKRTFTRTQMACANRGWDVFNQKYLSVEEQDRFYKSEIYAALPWSTLFKGEPGEISTAMVWNSTTFSDWVSTAQNTIFKKLKVEEPKIRVTIEEHVQGGMDDGPLKSSVCMYRGETWYQCYADRVCKSYGITGGGKYWYEMSKSAVSVTEYGSTEKEAMSWLVTNMKFRSKDGEMPRRECEMDKTSVRCERLR